LAKLKIMAIYAHPADPITDCGGTLAMHAERGDDVVVLTMTHGGRIHPNLFAEEWRKEKPDLNIVNAKKDDIIIKKKKELERAAEIIGINKLITLDYDDNYIGVSEDIVLKIAEEIANERPDVIIADYPMNAAYPDSHTMATIMVFHAINRAGLCLKNIDGHSEFHVKQIYLTKLPVNARDGLSLGGLRNDLYIDISSVVGKKIKAMDQFVSQGYNAEFARKFVESHDGDRGRAAGVNFAEAFFRVYNETEKYLPVTDYAMNKDVLTTHRSYSMMNIREMFPIKRE